MFNLILNEKLEITGKLNKLKTPTNNAKTRKQDTKKLEMNKKIRKKYDQNCRKILDKIITLCKICYLSEIKYQLKITSIVNLT